MDGPVSGMDSGEMADAVAKEKPLVVGISSITATYYRAFELAKNIKSLMDIPILIGGPHASIMPHDILNDGFFDIVVAHEGEFTTLELVNEFKKNPGLLKDKKTLKGVDGIFFRDGRKVVGTKPRALIENLDVLPFPARHLVDLKAYKPLPNQYKRLPITNMVAIRGCPFSCTYCSNSAVFGKRIRAFSPQRVVDEIRHLRERYGIKEISFWDDNLTIDKKWMTAVCDLLIKERVDVTWCCYGRVNTVDSDILKKMSKAGCWNIFYGLESGNQELLDIIKKGITLQQIRDAMKWTSKAGIETRGSFMIALPGETPELARKTIDFAVDLDLDYAQFCITTPFPGTELYEQAKKYGKLSKEYDKYNIWDPVFVPYGYKDAEEIKEMEREAMRRFYMRPRYITKRILKLRSLGDIKRNIEGVKLVMGFTKSEPPEKKPR
ncbi:MAG: radical SAM protein [Candidatus Aenigmarchaeota archaeon]|nr:radical SAM protein [Candidatus Aenigmarchaeota archaeon]